jgi:hypothetical protein
VCPCVCVYVCVCMCRSVYQSTITCICSHTHTHTNTHVVMCSHVMCSTAQHSTDPPAQEMVHAGRAVEQLNKSAAAVKLPNRLFSGVAVVCRDALQESGRVTARGVLSWWVLRVVVEVAGGAKYSSSDAAEAAESISVKFRQDSTIWASFATFSCAVTRALTSFIIRSTELWASVVYEEQASAD